MHPQDEIAMSQVADEMAAGRLESFVAEHEAGGGIGEISSNPSATGATRDNDREEGLGRLLRQDQNGGRSDSDFSRRRSSLGGAMRSGDARRLSGGGMMPSRPRRPGVLDKMREAFGGSNRHMMRLPEGVEGVFEPSLAGGRLKDGHGVSVFSPLPHASDRV